MGLQLQHGITTNLGGIFAFCIWLEPSSSDGTWISEVGDLKHAAVCHDAALLTHVALRGPYVVRWIHDF